jgi:hypothetical protein
MTMEAEFETFGFLSYSLSRLLGFKRNFNQAPIKT